MWKNSRVSAIKNVAIIVMVVACIPKYTHPFFFPARFLYWLLLGLKLLTPAWINAAENFAPFSL